MEHYPVLKSLGEISRTKDRRHKILTVQSYQEGFMQLFHTLVDSGFDGSDINIINLPVKRISSHNKAHARRKKIRLTSLSFSKFDSLFRSEIHNVLNNCVAEKKELIVLDNSGMIVSRLLEDFPAFEEYIKVIIEFLPSGISFLRKRNVNKKIPIVEMNKCTHSRKIDVGTTVLSNLERLRSPDLSIFDRKEPLKLLINEFEWGTGVSILESFQNLKMTNMTVYVSSEYNKRLVDAYVMKCDVRDLEEVIPLSNLIMTTKGFPTFEFEELNSMNDETAIATCLGYDTDISLKLLEAWKDQKKVSGNLVCYQKKGKKVYLILGGIPISYLNLDIFTRMERDLILSELFLTLVKCIKNTFKPGSPKGCLADEDMIADHFSTIYR